ncbi:MAG: hypothetical protein MJA30_21335 [Cytophagales bacterium]|nr:hypothetical protein [Cytophagales bacterium]
MDNSRLSWLEKRRNKEEVASEEFLFKLYQKLFGNVRRWAGDVRLSDRNMGIDFPGIRTEPAQLLEDARYWLENGMSPG